MHSLFWGVCLSYQIHNICLAFGSTCQTYWNNNWYTSNMPLIIGLFVGAVHYYFFPIPSTILVKYYTTTPWGDNFQYIWVVPHHEHSLRNIRSIHWQLLRKWHAWNLLCCIIIYQLLCRYLAFHVESLWWICNHVVPVKRDMLEITCYRIEPLWLTGHVTSRC